MKQFYVIAASLVGVATFAQTGVISGKIVDAQDQFSLPGASVRIENSNKYTISEQNGTYQFLNLPEGTYTIYVDYLGYTREIQKVVVRSNATATANFQLHSGSYKKLEEIIIFGDYSKGQAKALNQQKNNGNITNIISSDQVGRFPDANIGDALKRVPGITMQNDQGEARNIIVRGLSPELNSVTLNGDRIPSAEGDNRNVQMDLIPSDMISTIEVNKTITPDMDADAIGGSVNLITRAVPNKERVSVTLSGGYAPIREKMLNNFSFVYGNRFFKNKLGIVASGSFQKQSFGSDNIEAVWKKDKFDNVFVSQMDIRKYDVERVRRSFSIGSDYVFNENNRLDFSAIYNWRDDRENRYRTRYRDLKPNYDSNNNIIDYTGDIRRETKGGIDNNRNQNTRLEDQRVLNLSMKGEHLLSPKLDMNWAVSYSKASEDRPRERYIDYQLRKVNMGANLQDTNLPLITGVDENPANFSFRKLTENHNYTDEDEFGAKLNFRVPFSIFENQKGRMRFGARLRVKDKMRNNQLYSYKPTTPFGNMAQIENVFYSGKGYNPGEQYIPGYFVSNAYLGRLQLSNSSLFKETDEPAEYLALNYDANEKITAAYIRWDQDLSEKTSIIIGARVERTDIKYTGNFVLDEENLEAKITSDNHYTNILPSISIKHNFNKDFILRAAISTSIARPNYYHLSPYVSALPQDLEINAGNPNLKATYATNFDVMIERYFKNVGLLSGGLFYKKLDNFIYTYRDSNYTLAKFSQDYPTIANPVPAGENWQFTQARNGESVDVFGLEIAAQKRLDFLPGFLRNFNIYANYTFTTSNAKGITNADGEARSGLSLPKTAPHIFNTSLSWEDKAFSARLSANFTSSYLDEIGGDEFEDMYYDKQFFLDFNASYKFNKNFRIFLEANNLTNQPLRYYQGVSHRVMQLEYYQPRYTLGVKYDF